jgi:hypothetical protein
MGILASLLEDVRLPRMIQVRQHFRNNALADVAKTLTEELAKPVIARRIRPGMRIAVGVGSRGMADLPLLVAVVVDELKKQGALPFIVPAMGSHGGATADGQTALLAALGVTETAAGCPIVSSMRTVELGALDNGLPVLMDEQAMQSDGIVVINRVKPHTSFSGPIESGLTKMITIGLGKQKGADACHALGFGHMARNIVDMVEIKLAKAPILFGVATVENAYDKILKIVAVPAEDIVETEKLLLAEAKENMPAILFNPLDVLVVDQMGKEFSGTGMDPNITGRAGTPFLATTQQVARMAVLDLTKKSGGNATGIGLADVCTRRLFDKIDFDPTYANHLTSTALSGAKIPVIMDADRLAIQAAVKTCNAPDPTRLRLVRVRNTLHLDRVLISDFLVDEAERHPDVSVIGQAEEWAFDADGNLNDLADW